MPKIYEYFGFIFFFYSNEHEPIHVHVLNGGRESIFEIIMVGGKLEKINEQPSNRPPLTDREKQTARNFIGRYYKNIIDKWVNFFILKKRVRNTIITKRL